MQRSAIADTICRTIELGVTITGAALDGEDRTHVFCEVLEPKNTCPGCGRPGRLRDHIDREVADLPIVGHPTRLHIWLFLIQSACRCSARPPEWMSDRKM